jgi:hypothetical protein
LLNNARESDDYDVSQILNQALEYLFSERGDFIRDRTTSPQLSLPAAK